MNIEKNFTAEEHDIAVPQEDCNLVIISDLHVGEGYSASSRTRSRVERFFSDEAFRNLLQRLHADNAPTGRPLKLIINGDFLDFLRASSVPAARERDLFRRYFRKLGLIAPEGDFEIHPYEDRYGLRTEEYKSVWKLHRICEGHPLVFEALAEFIARGNRLVIIKGNHDFELIWPAVQRELIKLLAKKLSLLNGHPRKMRERLALIGGRVEFCQRAYVIENQVYIEHGHQYDHLTKVDKPLLNNRELHLPPGAIFSRYLINMIENLAPFVTFMQGNATVLKALLAAYRWRALRLLMRHFPVVTTMLLRRHRGFALSLFLGLLPYLFVAGYTIFFISLPMLWEGYAHWLMRVTGTFGELIVSRWPFNLAFCGGAFMLLKGPARLFGPKFHLQFPEAFAQARLRIREAHARVKKFIVLGHTHAPIVKHLGDDWWYLNSGSWVPVLERAHANPLSGQMLLSYILFTRQPNGDFEFDLRFWNDKLGRSERLRG